MGWRRFVSRTARDRARAEEIEAHLDLYVDELVARGRTPEAARREARLAFGNARATREEVDDMNRLPVLEVLGRDVRYAVRVLRRSPAFTMTAVVTLALAIGANTAVFSLANTILLRPLPYPHPEQLAAVQTTVRGPKGQDVDESQDGTSWEALRDGTTTVDVAMYAGDFGHGVNLVVDHAAATVSQSRVSAGYFHVLGVVPFMGREFTRDEDRPGGPAVVVLSYPLWQRLLGGAPDVCGKTLMLRGETYVVVGVMPEAFRTLGDPTDVWTPARPSRTGEGAGTNYGVIARVKEGHMWADADNELRNLGLASFQTRGLPKGITAWWSLVPMQQALVAGVAEPIEMLAAAVGMVLLIACVNLAALLLARGGSRTKEIATRMSLGSGRRAVVRQLMVESVVLGLIGGAIGVGIGYLGLAGLKVLGGETFAEWKGVTLDARMLGATAGLSLLTSLAFGLVPSLQASRLDVNAALSEGGSRGIAGGSRHWVRRALVATEVALGVVLLVVTGLLVRTFVNLRSLDPGFDPAHVTTGAISLQDARYKTSPRVNQLFEDSLAELTRTPGVESAAVSLELPYRRLLNDGFKFTDEAPDASHSMANVMYVTSDFFKTLKIPVRSGRTFGPSDRAGTPLVAVVNDTFVRSWAKGKSPVGRRFRMEGEEREIVGIVGDVQVTTTGIGFPGNSPGPLMTSPLVFIPAAQTRDGYLQMVHTWFRPMWSVRTSASVNPAEVLQRAIGHADPLLPLQDVQSLAAVQAAATSQQRLLMTLVGVLAVVALLLAVVGIHGLIAHSVVERTREFGIRMALGATAFQTMRSVALSGVALSAVGAAVGVGLAWVAVGIVESFSFLFHVDKHDPLTYVGVAACLLVVSAVASVLPAWTILRLDPAETLRS